MKPIVDLLTERNIFASPAARVFDKTILRSSHEERVRRAAEVMARAIGAQDDPAFRAGRLLMKSEVR